MKVKFLPSEIELEIEPNQTVMELAHKNGIFVKSVCNGVPNCAECRVKLVEGEYNVLPPSSKELSLIGSGHFIDQRRLSCQLYCFGDVTVDLTEQVKKQGEGPPGSRRFQVDLRNEGVVSKAVTGNLIQQDQELVRAVTQDVDDSGSGNQENSSSKARLEAMMSGGEEKSQSQTEKQPGGRQGRNRNRNRQGGGGSRSDGNRQQQSGGQRANAAGGGGGSQGPRPEGAGSTRRRRRRKPKA